MKRPRLRLGKRGLSSEPWVTSGYTASIGTDICPSSKDTGTGQAVNRA